MSEQPPKEVITLGRQPLDPEDISNYRQKIQAARGGAGVEALKGNTPLGHVPRPNIPLLSKHPTTSAPVSTDGGVQPRPPGSPVIRPETAQQIKDMQDAQTKQTQTMETEVKKELEKEKTDDLFDMFDFAGKSEQDRILNNKKRRKEIESRLEPMKLEDLIMKDEVQQDVPIVPGGLTVRYRSITPAENLFVKKVMASETVNSDQYTMEKYGLSQLACSIVSINGIPLPDHRDAHDEPSDSLFQAKLKILMKKSAYLMADLGVNFYWFDLRVRRLLNPDDLKNG